MAPRTPKSPDDKPAKPKPAAKAKPAVAAKPAKPAKPTLKVVDKAEAKPASAVLKLKDLVDAVAASTGGKKPEVKKTVEATLAAIGSALAAQTALVLPPLGKLRVAKAAAGTLTLKLRLADAARAAGKGLAEDGEDS